MSIGPNGENLIFLISQPRSGSTLLQRMLATHPQVSTSAETWMMLHPMYALRDKGYEAEYVAETARVGLRALLEQMPHGVGDYYEAARLMYRRLYARALGDRGATHFLDKTPRYYLIIPELHETFPMASYLILLRNPLAVLISMVRTWARHGRLHHVSRWRKDLYEAPELLLEGAVRLGDRSMVVRYEQMLVEPKTTMQAVCKFVDIEFDPAMIDYGQSSLPIWALGDTEEVYAQTHPMTANADRWVEALSNAQIWRLAHEYLDRLGPEICHRLGYEADHLAATLEQSRPHPMRLWCTASLDWLATPAPRPQLTHYWVDFCHLARDKGVTAAASEALRYLIQSRGESQ